MLKKVFLVVGILFCYSNYSAAQTKELAVPLAGQNADRWCWAASIEMVFQYYNEPTGNPDLQCDIVRNYFHNRLYNAYLPPASNWQLQAILSNIPANCNDLCGTVELPSGAYNSPNQTIHFNFHGMYSTSLYPSYFDIILSDFDYNSIEDRNLLTWEQYKAEIDHCRPVILLYNATGYVGGNSSINHAVVGKGYHMISQGNFFIINDPWEVCLGDTYLLNSQVLGSTASIPQDDPLVPSTSTQTVNSVLSMVHHISPKQYDCDQCKSSFRDEKLVYKNQLISNLKECENEFVGTALTQEKSTVSLDKIYGFNPQENYITPVKYLSYESIRDSKELSFKNLSINTNMHEVIYTGCQDNLEATFRCNEKGDACMVEMMKMVKAAPIVKVNVNGEAITLDNSKPDSQNGDPSTLNYEKVYYPPYTFVFYRFEYKRVSYFYPMNASARAFLYGGQENEPTGAVPEKIVLERLSKYTQDNPWMLPED